MTKYSALSQYLTGIPGKQVSLTFSEIEEIIESQLPSSAFNHPQFWANERKGTHIWAHLWQAAGWLKDSVDFERRIVTFRRAHESEIDVLDTLKPKTKETIYDLLQQLGISTDEWLTTENGEEVDNVKANPNHCYNWSFGSIQEGFALCIWHGTLELNDGQIVFEENLRELSRQLQTTARQATNETAKRTRSITQAIRARAFDDALNVCYARGRPVSVILTEGDRRSREELGSSSSHVLYRSLDPIKWYVHSYDNSTGAARMVRGVLPPGVGEETDSVESLDHTGPPDDVQLRAIKIRRGQAKFRETLLSAYGRSCAVTGCTIVELLEAAHIQPHAEEPNYSVTNGILLRADIHTLFDLNFLSVDSRLRIRVAPSLMKSEYKEFDGKLLTVPGAVSEMPSQFALSKRYDEFRLANKL